MNAASLKKQNNTFKTVPTIFGGLIGLCIFFTVITTDFLTGRNIINILQQGSFLIILCMGVVVVKIMGGIELSVGGVMSLSGMMMAYCMVNLGFPVFLSVIVALLVGVVAGVFNGIFVQKMHVPSFVATLGTQYITVSLALILNDGNVIWGMPEVIGKVSNCSILGLPFIVFITILCVVISFVVLRYTVLGGYFYAIGGNEEALILSGKNSARYKILGYMYCGVFAAVAGILMTIRMQAAQPTVGVGMEFEAFSACVLGGAVASGRGTVPGALAGALFIIVLRNGLNTIGVSSFYQLAIIGIAIVMAIVITLFISRKMEGVNKL